MFGAKTRFLVPFYPVPSASSPEERFFFETSPPPVVCLTFSVAMLYEIFFYYVAVEVYLISADPLHSLCAVRSRSQKRLPLRFLPRGN